MGRALYVEVSHHSAALLGASHGYQHNTTGGAVEAGARKILSTRKGLHVRLFFQQQEYCRRVVVKVLKTSIDSFAALPWLKYTCLLLLLSACRITSFLVFNSTTPCQCVVCCACYACLVGITDAIRYYTRCGGDLRLAVLARPCRSSIYLGWRNERCDWALNARAVYWYCRTYFVQQ